MTTKIITEQIKGLPTITVDFYAGADIGAKINAAIAANGVAHYFVKEDKVASGLNFSTSVNPPLGSTLTFAFGSYDLINSAQFLISHRDTVLDFGGAVFHTVSNLPIVDIGKLSAHDACTVTMNGATVTWVSGPKLDNFDIGDFIIIDAAQYTVATIIGPTSLTVAGAGAVHAAPVACAGAIYPSSISAVSTNGMPSIVKNGSLHHAGGAAVAIRALFAFDVRVENMKACFAYDYGLNAKGCINGYFDISCIQCGVVVRDYIAGGSGGFDVLPGYATGSNNVHVTGTIQLVPNTLNQAMYLAESGVAKVDMLFQDNESRYGLYIKNQGIVDVTGYFENNGNLLVPNGSADIYVENSMLVTVHDFQATTASNTYNVGGSAIVFDASQGIVENGNIKGSGANYAHAVAMINDARVARKNLRILGMSGTIYSGDNASNALQDDWANYKVRSIYVPTQELVYNGNFAQGDAAWTFTLTGGTWTGASGAAVANAATGSMSQIIISNLQNGLYYRYSFELPTFTAGTLKVYINGVEHASYTAADAGTIKTIVYQHDAVTDNTVAFVAAGFSGSVDNVSIVPVPITADEIAYLSKSIRIVPKGPFADNAAALAGGCVVGELYYVNAATNPQPIYIVH